MTKPIRNTDNATKPQEGSGSQVVVTVSNEKNYERLREL